MPYIAVTQIESTHPKTKQRTITSPGAPYSPKDDTERDFLLKAGALRAVKQADVTGSPHVPAADPEDDSNVEIGDMTKDELIAFAKDNDITINEKATKAEILKVIAGEDDLV